MVEFNHGLTFDCGLGGSDLTCKLAFLKLEPIVLTPICAAPLFKKFMPPTPPTGDL